MFPEMLLILLDRKEKVEGGINDMLNHLPQTNIPRTTNI